MELDGRNCPGNGAGWSNWVKYPVQWSKMELDGRNHPASGAGWSNWAKHPVQWSKMGLDGENTCRTVEKSGNRWMKTAIKVEENGNRDYYRAKKVGGHPIIGQIKG